MANEATHKEETFSVTKNKIENSVQHRNLDEQANF